MKSITKILLASACMLVSLPTEAKFAKAPKTLPGGWVYEWGDEFNGSRLDSKKWTYELGVIRNEGASQSYTKKAVSVKGGKLLITSKHEKTKNSNYQKGAKQWWRQIETQPYSSGSITTKGIKNFEGPGRLEVRAKLPNATGAWPAIWLLGANGWGWPKCGEVDMMEHLSQEPGKSYSTLHWGELGPGKKAAHKTHMLKNPFRKFYTYILEWDDKTLTISIDKKKVLDFNIDDANYPDGRNPFRTPMYLILNTALGGKGTWPEPGNAKKYPCVFEIDYVRYYVKKGKNAKDKKEEKKTKSAREAASPRS